MPAYDDSFSPPAPIATVSLRHPGSSLTVTDVWIYLYCQKPNSYTKEK